MSLQESVDITILDAIRFAASAWSNVKKTTITNCWKATGIIPCEEISSDTVMEAAKEDVSLSAFEERNSIQALIDKLPFTDPINAEEYLCLDDDEEEAVLINSITDEDIVRMILGEETESDEEEEKEVKKRVSIEEACRGAEVMLQFFEQQDNNIKLEFSETIVFRSI